MKIEVSLVEQGMLIIPEQLNLAPILMSFLFLSFYNFLKGGVDGFSYFSLILVISFSNRNKYLCI
jgi:hypothetical protein